MVVGDIAKSYSTGEHSAWTTIGDMWNYGVEAWCNMEGQYVTIVADLANLSGKPYLMTICSLGIMGVEYVRQTPIPTTVDIVEQSEKTLLIENISPAQKIGNLLDIQIRQKAGSEQNWVSII